MKSSVKSGLLAALFVTCWQLFIFFSDQQLSKLGAYSPLVSLIIIFPFTFIGIKYKRDRELEGYLNTREGLKEGAAISAVAALGVGIFTYFFYKFALTDFYLGEARKVLENQQADDIEGKMESAASLFAPFNRSAFSLITTLGAGLFFSFISITFLSKKREEED